ncbi:serum amyloid A-5 protein-like [Mesocricetus auratus]|uniref:Serum amyloid A protein n=1 Tax=Mesocricetus auratus TaxID=10036 RepID=A0A1U7RDX9_MESAU|nr:serum amyloid A-5 protein-like [Mesocricetus auratus]
MKFLTGLIFCSLILEVISWFSFIHEAYQGAEDMWQVNSDAKKANWRDSDKYFHVRGKYDAAKKGPGVMWAAEVISDARESFQSLIGLGHEDFMAEQEANRWGCRGKDPNH